jgi:hypothetical protein
MATGTNHFPNLRELREFKKTVLAVIVPAHQAMSRLLRQLEGDAALLCLNLASQGNTEGRDSEAGGATRLRGVVNDTGLEEEAEDELQMLRGVQAALESATAQAAEILVWRSVQLKQAVYAGRGEDEEQVAASARDAAAPATVPFPVLTFVEDPARRSSLRREHADLAMDSAKAMEAAVTRAAEAFLTTSLHRLLGTLRALAEEHVTTPREWAAMQAEDTDAELLRAAEVAAAASDAGGRDATAPPPALEEEEWQEKRGRNPRQDAGKAHAAVARAAGAAPPAPPRLLPSTLTAG